MFFLQPRYAQRTESGALDRRSLSLRADARCLQKPDAVRWPSAAVCDRLHDRPQADNDTSSICWLPLSNKSSKPSCFLPSHLPHRLQQLEQRTLFAARTHPRNQQLQRTRPAAEHASRQRIGVGKKTRRLFILERGVKHPSPPCAAFWKQTF
jgi:hypothetical protein